MKVCLVTASTFNGVEFARDDQPLDEDSPLGILSLAASLRAARIDVAVCDLTEFLRKHYRPGRESVSLAAEWIHATDADIFAFSTICSTYPLTLRLAGQVRERAPGRPIVLGGPQATVTDRRVLQAFDCIDFVVRGEGEYVLPAVVDALQGQRPLDDVAGIAYRANQIVRRTQDAPLIMDLDALPDPAYDLDPLLPRRRFVSLELGRGCPFACSFCSTNDFFRRKFRLKSPARVIEQMVRVHDAYGHRRFSLVHDMFTVDRRKVVAFCEAMRQANTGLLWTCSARTDSVDPALLDLMADAGCVSVFFGVESGSPDQQRRLTKDLDLDEARRVIAHASGRGLSTTVSLIIGFPDETADDVRQTVSFMMDAARHDQADPCVHLLAPLVDTPLAVRYRDQVQLYEETHSDASVSTIGLRTGSPERRLIEDYPDLFLNFYLMPMPLPPAYLNEARLFLSNGLRRFRWLFIALHEEAGGILKVFDDWLTWRTRPVHLLRYYRHRTFVLDLLNFLSETYDGAGYRATDVLLRYSKAILAELMSDGPPEPGETPANGGAHVEPVTVGYDDEAVPTLAARTWLVTMRGSAPAVIEALRARRPLTPDETDQPTTLLVRCARDDWEELIELSPLSASVLQLCDGTRRVADVIDTFADRSGEIEGIPPEAVCDAALRSLGDARYLRFVSDAHIVS